MVSQVMGSWSIDRLHDVNDPESMAWLARNQSMFEGSYPRLREVREMLEVVFEMDPPPSFDMVPIQWFSKEAYGYTINVPGGSELRVRRDPDRGEWTLSRKTTGGVWRKVDSAPSLWLIRSARTDIVHMARVQKTAESQPE